LQRSRCSKRPSTEKSNDFSLRGIERIIWNNKDRQKVVQMVLQQQKIQNTKNKTSSKASSTKFLSAHEMIRRTSLMISQKSRYLAIQLAIIDAQAVE